MGKRHTGLKILFLFILMALIGGTAFLPYYLSLAPASDNDEEVLFQVKQGESLHLIADHLKSYNLIKSEKMLIIYSRIRKTSVSFRAGTYSLKRGMNLKQIHDSLVFGEEIRLNIVIPEGWTMRQIAERLEEKQLADADIFLEKARDPELLAEFGIPADSFEGYLYPDSYSFPMNYPVEEILKSMARNFFDHISKIYPDYRDMTEKQFHDKIIVASIVEKEYKRVDEAPIIASVFFNRLRINIHLQSCATVNYIITDIQGRPHTDTLYKSDLEIDSPYNTYKYLGLPKGPVANPGPVALNAAFYPANTNYYFFVLEDPSTGKHTFTTYLDEHIEAKYRNKKNY